MAEDAEGANGRATVTWGGLRERIPQACDDGGKSLGIVRHVARLDRDDRDGLARLGCRPHARSTGELGILAEQRGLELLELLRWVEPELVDERRAGVAVGLERVGLAPGAVEREH